MPIHCSGAAYSGVSMSPRVRLMAVEVSLTAAMPKSSSFGVSGLPGRCFEQDVLRLHVAVDDSLGMGRAKTKGDSLGDPQRTLNVERAGVDGLTQTWPIDKLHRDIR